MINTYGYCVIKSKLGLPLHVVEIRSDLVHGVYVYSTARQAQGAVNTAKYSLDCDYDPDFHFAQNIIDAYKNADALFSHCDSYEIYVAG